MRLKRRVIFLFCILSIFVFSAFGASAITVSGPTLTGVGEEPSTTIGGAIVYNCYGTPITSSFSPCGDRVAWYFNIYPRAVYFNNKTFVTFHGEPSIKQYDPYAMVYDHSLGSWSTPIKVGTNQISPTTDSHGNPAIIRSADGYIHVFYGAHSSCLQHAKSNSTDSVSAWTEQTCIGSNYTYPQILKNSSGRIYVLIRNQSDNNDAILFYSDDNGSTWNNATPEYVLDADPATTSGTAANGLFYPYSNIDASDNIHLAFHWFKSYHGIPNWATFPREDVYYIYRDASGNWKDITGAAVTIPVTPSTVASYKVFNSAGGDVDLSKPAIDSTGKVYLAFTDEANHKVIVAYYSGGSWISADVCSIPYVNDNPPAAYVDSSDNLHVFVRTDFKTIAEYKSTDGGNTFSQIATTIALSASSTQSLYNLISIDGSHANLRFMFFSFKGGSRQASDLYAYGDSGFLQ